MTDWGFHADDPRGALEGGVAHWCFWWSDEAQAHFEEEWGDDAEALADELADLYSFVWPWMIEHALPARAPETQQRIDQFVADPALVGRAQGTNPRTILGVSTVWGAFHTVRKRRAWDPPSWQPCGACGRCFLGGEPPVWTYRQFGPSRYCPTCCLVVRNGCTGAWTRDGVLS